MKKIFLILMFAFSFFLTSCRSKKVQISKEVVSDHRQFKKDSLLEVKNEVKTALFSFERNENFELEIISDKGKDSVILEKIRSPTSEKIIVRGGSLRLKTTQHTANKITKKDTLRVNNTSVRTEIEEEKITEKQEIKKEKEVSRNLPLKIIFWILIILAIIFIAWRLKLFRGFSVFK